MEVINNDQKFKVYWMYNTTAIPWLMAELGHPEKELEMVDLLPGKKQVDYFNEKHPHFDRKLTLDDVEMDRTYCFLMEDGKVIDSVSVCRYYKDPEDRDKARKYAMTKLLRKQFPNTDSVEQAKVSKATRKLFWDAYQGRHPQAAIVPMAVAAKT